MAVELADAKGSLKVTAEELDNKAQILTRWRREQVESQNAGADSSAQVSREQQEICRDAGW